METAIIIPNKDKIDHIFDLLDVSEATRVDYKYRIKVFIEHVNQNGFDNNSFLQYKRTLASKNDYSVSTKNKYLASARIFLKELNRQGLLPMDVTQNIKAFKQGKKHKQDGLNCDEMNSLSIWMKDLPNDAKSSRLRAIFSLLALQGLRQCEIIRLDVGDLDLVAKTALITGKGRDDKELINLHPETARNLKDYLKLNKISDGSLFVSLSNSSKGHRLTTRALRGLIKDILSILGIEKTVHGFRHYFTTTLVKVYKGDLLEVAQYTRHKSLEMLQVYNDHVKRQEDLPRFYDAFNDVGF
jgi:integrase